MPFTICPGVTALGALTVDGPDGAPPTPGGGDLPLVVLSRSGLCALALMLLIGTLPAGLRGRPAGLAGVGTPIGEAFRCKPLVEPTVLRPDFMAIWLPTCGGPPTSPSCVGEVPRFAEFAGKTTTLAPEPLFPGAALP